MKAKTVKTASKRISFTGNSKLMRRNLSAQHLSAGKSKRVRSAANKTSLISKADSNKIRKMLPNK